MQAYTSITFRTPAKILWKLMKYSYITVTLISWSKNRCLRFFEFRKSSNVKVVLHSRKSMYCNFIFSTERPTKKEFFKKKKRKSKSHQFKSYASFFFFHCDIIFDKLSKLGQIFCVILLSGQVFQQYS